MGRGERRIEHSGLALGVQTLRFQITAPVAASFEQSGLILGTDSKSRELLV